MKEERRGETSCSVTDYSTVEVKEINTGMGTMGPTVLIQQHKPTSDVAQQIITGK